MGSIESILGKSVKEFTTEELNEFVKDTRQSMTAILEEDAMGGKASGGSRTKKASKTQALLQDLEDAL